MAARSVAAAQSSPSQCSFRVFLFVFSFVNFMFSNANPTYSRQDLLLIGTQYKQAVTSEFLHSRKIPEDIARTPGSPWIVVGPGKRRRRRRQRKQKRGCRSGVLARLKEQPHKPPLPSVFLTNARSITNKMDELQLQIAANKLIEDCCILLITETWLHPLIPDGAIELAGRTAFRWDRNSDSGKSKGGGLCIYVNNNWCSNTNIIDSHCSADLEYITVKCRPFYLPREFTVVMVTAVYIPPDANASIALGHLHTAINTQQSTHPEAALIIAGDFNHADLKTVLPKFEQHIKCATRGENTLDKAYSNIKKGFKAKPLPHLGQSDHLSIFLTPAYTPLRRKTPSTIKTVKTWPEGASSQLQDCFERTNWDIFDSPDLEEHTNTVLCYIQNCVDNVTVDKRIRVFPNRKPWMTKEVQTLLKDRNTAFRSGDSALYSTARANLKRGIRDAKAAHKRKIEDHFTNNDPRRVWQGIQQITNYKPNTSRTTDGDASLAEELNCFFARFEVKPAEPATPLPPTPHQPDNLLPAGPHQPPLPPPTTPNNSHTLTVQEHEVRRVLRAVNPRKAAGPDGVTGRVLRECADQLTAVFTKIFNLSLSQSIIPSCLKSATVIPLPKKTVISGLNDYRPVALTPVIMKCFERLVQKHIKASLPPTFDSHQFAYRANRSTEDAISTALHTALTHLEHQGSYVRMLFIDFSSAFNTIIPSKLVTKLTDLGLSQPICLWIKDFLSNRPQNVRLGPHLSPTITLSTGSPQGCVLSPLLYTLYTHDCVPTHSTNTIVKFADDTTVVGLISGGDETAYRDEVQRLAVWCSDNNLILNTAKTKEIIIDFRRNSADPPPLCINGVRVERVSDFRFLGTHIAEDLTWTTNTTTVVKKAQQRLHFLRVLRKNNLEEKLLVSFYRCSIESVLAYCISTWYASCSAANRKALQRVINTAQKLTGCPLPSLEDIFSSRCLGRAATILKDKSHPGHQLFQLLPSGRRFRSIKSRTNRLKDSFYPRAIRELNSAQ